MNINDETSQDQTSVVDGLPTLVSYPHKSPTRIPLGVGSDFNEVSWDMSEHPHVLISGATGSGKSSLVRSIAHYIKYNSSAQCLTVGISEDSKTLSAENYLSRTVNALRYVMDQLNERYKLSLPAERPEHDLLQPSVLIIDNFDKIASSANSELGREVMARLLQIARIGRSVRVHLVVVSQRIDFLPQEVKNLPLHISMGARLGNTDDENVADGVAKLPAGRGLSFDYFAGTSTLFQAYSGTTVYA